MASSQRGTVLEVPGGERPGLLFVDGRQVPFKLAGVWSSGVAPAVNQTVLVDLDDAGAVVRIVVLDAQTLAKEKLGQFTSVAGEQGQQAAAQGKEALGRVRARMGTLLMVLSALLIIAWFFLPAIEINIGFGVAKSFTVSDLLGIHLSQDGGNSRFGFLSFLGLLAVFAPWAAPWLKARWAPLLNAAPLALFAAAVLDLKWQVHGMVQQAITAAGQWGGAQGQAAAQGMADQMVARLEGAMSPGIGLWLVVLLGVALAVIGVWRFLRPRPLTFA